MRDRNSDRRPADRDQRALRERVEKAIEEYRSDGGYELPGVAQNTVAT